MAIYTVMWKYTSSLGGPFSQGDVIDLEPALAEAINRDSPGVLAEGKVKVKPSPDLSKGERKDGKNRMVTPENFGVITRDNFMAVADKEE